MRQFGINNSFTSKPCDARNFDSTEVHSLQDRIAMTLTGIHRSVLGTLLRHARCLTKNKSVIWLQKCPEVVEFGQPPVTTTHAADLSKVSLSFPKSLWLFLSSHVPSRVISGKDLRRIVRAGFRTNPLGGNVSELFQCAKLVSEQVKLHHLLALFCKTSHGLYCCRYG